MNTNIKHDAITLERIKQLHPDLINEVKEIYNKICESLTSNSRCRFAYTLRTFPEQAELYAQGRTKIFDANGKRLGKVTNAKAGQSYHNYGLAIDIVLLIDKDKNGTFESASWDIKTDFDKDEKSDWMEIVEIFKSYGWNWGGDFKSLKDYPHFEKSFGLSVSELLKRYNSGKFIPGTNYVKIK